MILLVLGVSFRVISLCQITTFFLYRLVFVGSCLVPLRRVHLIVYKNKIPGILFSHSSMLSSFSLPFLASLNLFNSILSSPSRALRRVYIKGKGAAEVFSLVYFFRFTCSFDFAWTRVEQGEGVEIVDVAEHNRSLSFLEVFGGVCVYR